MKSIDFTPEEQSNRRRGLIISIVAHAVIILLAVLPFLQYPEPPPGQEGVLVSFGEPDVGEGEDRPDVQQEDPFVEPTPPATTPKKEVTPRTSPAQEKILTADDAEIRLRKQKESDSKVRAQQQAAEETAKKKAAEDAARRTAEADAKKKAEYDKTKKQYGDFFGGTGKGEKGKTGNQGDPKGDPDANKLEGISKGTGVVGDGLSNRGVRKATDITDKSQKTGRVVVYVCVDRKGNVIRADYTQRGSTTSDPQLIDLAKKNARGYLFTDSDLDEQCGTITYDFKVK